MTNNAETLAHAAAAEFRAEVAELVAGLDLPDADAVAEDVDTWTDDDALVTAEAYEWDAHNCAVSEIQEWAERQQVGRPVVYDGPYYPVGSLADFYDG